MFSFIKTRSKKKIPPWLTTYTQLEFKNQNQEDSTFCVLDCETTGLSKSDSIITIGAVLCSRNEITTHAILDQKYPLAISGKSSEIHGELGHEEEIDLTEHLKELINFIQNHIIVGHNISFDIGKINQLLYKTYGLKLKNKVLDTVNLAIRLDPVTYERSVGGQHNLSLDNLCEAYQIPVENRHTALGDAYLTAQLLQRLLYKLEEKGITRVV